MKSVCAKCYAEFDKKGAKFCTRCGTKLVQMMKEPSSKYDSHIDYLESLDSNIYLAKDYINPHASNKYDLEGMIDPEKAHLYRQREIEVNADENKKNRYSPQFITTNQYQEQDFPVIGIEPNLYEDTFEFTKPDEKIYYHSKVTAFSYSEPQQESITFAQTYGSHTNIIDWPLYKDSSIDSMENYYVTGVGSELYITESKFLFFNYERRGNVMFRLLSSGQNQVDRGTESYGLEHLRIIEALTMTVERKNVKALRVIFTWRKRNYIKIIYKYQDGVVSFSEEEARYIINLIGSLSYKRIMKD